MRLRFGSTQAWAVCLAASVLAGCSTHSYQAAALDQSRVPQAIEAASLRTAANVSTPVAGVAAHDGERWNCGAIGTLAAARSRAVAARLADLAAARAEVLVAGQRPNPTITIGGSYNQDKDPGDDSHFSVGPVFEYLWSPVDRGRIRAALADADAVRRRTEVLEAAWHARTAACQALIELARARRAYSMLDVRGTLLEEAVELARGAADAGLTTALTWQTLKLEANTVRLSRIEHFRAVTVAGADLASALNMSVPALGELRLQLSVPEGGLPGRHELQGHMLSHHPRILDSLAAYDKAEHDLELAIAAQYPDINLTPGYFFDQGDHVWSLVGGIVVPLFATHDAAIAAAAARRDAARLAFEQVQAELIASLQAAHARYLAARASYHSTVEVQAELKAGIAALESDLASGLVDGLLVKRAELQLAEVDARLDGARFDSLRALRGLERAAALPIDDPAFEAGLRALFDGSEPAGTSS